MELLDWKERSREKEENIPSISLRSIENTLHLIYEIHLVIKLDEEYPPFISV
jgi:hypothetical protein